MQNQVKFSKSSGDVKPERKTSILNAFNLIDSQGKGFITQNDIWSIIKRLHLDKFLTRAVATKVFKDLDTKHEGQVPFEKFFKSILTRQSRSEGQRLALIAFKTPAEKIQKLLTKIKRLPQIAKEKELTAEISWAISELSKPEKLYQPQGSEELNKELNDTDAQSEIMNWLEEYSLNSQTRRNSQDIAMAREFKLQRLKKLNLTRGISGLSPTLVKLASSNTEQLTNSLLDSQQGSKGGLPETHQPIIAKYHIHFNDVADVDHVDFDIFNFAEKVGRPAALPLVATHLFMQHHLFDLLDDTKFEAFVQEIYKGYRRDIPYHTDLHAADVAHCCNIYLMKGKLEELAELEALDVAAFLLSAVVHDFKHPGLNNVYLQNSGHPLAIRYNDISVLENYHIAQTFKLFQKTKFNILAGLSIHECKLMRKRMIQCVLATDMAKHSESVARLLGLIDNYEISNGENANAVLNKETELRKFESQQFLLNVCLHAADLGPPAKKFQQTRRWTHLLTEEFWNQGDLEKKQGLPVSSFCDRDTVDLPKAQMGFLQAVLIPFLKPITEIMPGVKFYLQNAENNCNEWENRVDEYKGKQKEIFKVSEMTNIVGAIVPPKMANRKGPTRSQTGAVQSTFGVYGGSEKSNDHLSKHLEEAKDEDSDASSIDSASDQNKSESTPLPLSSNVTSFDISSSSQRT